ncbi:hypothetical protein [Gorillibacterium sp. sgz5001074]|uniref:hypothetical protein n=1 Tax=Gorillibacterium sp. sgz5001074 TaxID=3446695 RepID=UPI003F672658
MKPWKGTRILVLLVALMAVIAAATGIFSEGGGGERVFTTVRGESVTLYGEGLYRYDSKAVAAQGIAQDWVTLVLAVPLLLLSLLWESRGSLKGRLLLTGTLGYFVYAYASYALLSMYNPIFLLYVALCSASFFAFIGSWVPFDSKLLQRSIRPGLPVKRIAGFLYVVGGALGLMWLGRILPSLRDGSVPIGLEHYTTLVIQVLDLAFVVPALFLGGTLLIRREPSGYMLATILLIKGLSMATACTAMIIGQERAGETVSLAEKIVFPSINLVLIYMLVLLFLHIREHKVDLSWQS